MMIFTANILVAILPCVAYDPNKACILPVTSTYVQSNMWPTESKQWAFWVTSFKCYERTRLWFGAHAVVP